MKVTDADKGDKGAFQARQHTFPPSLFLLEKRKSNIEKKSRRGAARPATTPPPPLFFLFRPCLEPVWPISAEVDAREQDENDNRAPLPFFAGLILEAE